jgi:DnaJ-class molecular chaperone
MTALTDTKPKTRTCKWCAATGIVMKTICPGLEKPVVCEDCDGRGKWDADDD